MKLPIRAILIVCLSLAATGLVSETPDGIVLTVNRGPGAGDLTLAWSSGPGPWTVYRSTMPAGLVGSGNIIAMVEGTSFTDTPPAGDIFYYEVTGSGSCGDNMVNRSDEDCDGTDDNACGGLPCLSSCRCSFFRPLQANAVTCPAGQTDFYGACVNLLKLVGAPNTGEYSVDTITANTAFHVTGLAIDRTSKPNKIYVTDLSNNRVLGWSSIGHASANPSTPCTNDTDVPGHICVIDHDKPADMVFGQADLSHGACNRDNNIGILGNPGPDTLCFTNVPLQTNIAEDEQGVNPAVDDEGNLYIPDVKNHRVLKYIQPFNSSVPGGGNSIADAVWGQPDLCSGGPNEGRGDGMPSQTSIMFPRNWYGIQLSVDAAGNVWVPDGSNGRVLRFPRTSQSADLVLGQADFSATAACSASDLRTLCRPTIAKVNPVTGELYVYDLRTPFGLPSDQLIVFTPPFSNGMAASRTMQPVMPPYTMGANYQPRFIVSGIEFNRYKEGPYADGEFWITEHFADFRALLLGQSGNVVNYIGGPTVDTYANFSAWDPVCGAFPFLDHSKPFRWFVGAPAFDDADNLYFPISRPSIIIRYPMPYQFRTLTNSAGQSVNCFPWSDGFMHLTPSGDGVTPMQWNATGPGRIGEGYFHLAHGNQLIAFDGRMMVWNDYLNKPFGADSDFVLGRPDAFTRNVSTWSWNPFPSPMAVHEFENRLWINAAGGQLAYFDLPLTPSSTPTRVSLHWQDDDSPLGEATIWPYWIAFDPTDGKMWLADANRLLRIANADQVDVAGVLYVDRVLGQVTKTGTLCNQGRSAPTAQTMCSTSSIAFDYGGNLFVVENTAECGGNNRITGFLRSDLQSATGMFPNLAASLVFNNTGSFTTPAQCNGTNPDGEERPDSPISVTFNRRNEMVVTRDGYYPGMDDLTGMGPWRALKQAYLFRTPLTKQTPDNYLRLPLGSGVGTFDDLGNLVIGDRTWQKIWIINFDRDPSWLWPIPEFRFDYRVEFANPRIVSDGNPVSLYSTVVPLDPGPQTITFRVSGLPEGIMAIASPSQCSSLPCNVTITLTKTGAVLAPFVIFDVTARSDEGYEKTVTRAVFVQEGSGSSERPALFGGPPRNEGDSERW